jgi:hypothetical protein
MLVKLAPNRTPHVLIGARLVHFEDLHVESPGWRLRNGTIFEYETPLKEKSQGK